MKKLFILLFVGAFATALQAQTMQWIAQPAGTVNGKCKCETNPKINKVCYALEYIPNATGILTSYTTGFMVSCTSLGSPVKKNESCTMTSSVQVVDVCSQSGQVLLNSSGNTGNNTHVTAGQPIILHQVCFYIPQHEKLRITEETITDLTTSITTPANGVVTEYPAYTEQTFYVPRPDEARPTVLVDFKASVAGDLVAQLDWTMNNLLQVESFTILRSVDGIDFENIGQVIASEVTSAFNSFQFFDRHAFPGKNYYKIVSEGAVRDESGVREVNFNAIPFAVSISPNPASAFITVEVTGAKTDYTISIIDMEGKQVLFEKADMRTRKSTLSVSQFHAGVYTIQVNSGKETHAEKMSIIR